MSTIRLPLSMLRQTLAVLALCIALGSVIRAQVTYPPLEFQQIGERRWRIIPDYPNPPPLKIRLNDSIVLEYTIHSGYETNFRSGPKIVDIIAKQIGDNKLNLAWLVHDINYEGYVKDRKVADRLLYSMLLEAGIPKARAAAVYAGVRLFGKSHHCNEEKRDQACGSPLIGFKEVTTSMYRRRGSLQSVLALPTFELQPLRLTSMTQEDKDAARKEIEKLFPEDSDAVKKELDQDTP